MKFNATRLVTLLCALPVSTTVMAHGGHEETASSTLHGLYHLIVTGGIPIALAIGLVVTIMFLRRSVDRN